MRDRGDTEAFAVISTALLVKGFLCDAPVSVSKVWPLLLLYARKTGDAYPLTCTLANQAGLSVRTVQVALAWLDNDEHDTVRWRSRHHRKATRRNVRVFRLGGGSGNFPLFQSVLDVFRELSTSTVAVYLALRTFAVAEYETDFARGGFHDRLTETLTHFPESTRVSARSGCDRHHIPTCIRELIAANLLGENEDNTWWIQVRMPTVTDE